MRVNRIQSLLISLLMGVVILGGSVLPGWGMDLLDFNGEDYEVPAGALAFFECNPVDSIYGLGFAEQTWLKNSPLLGDIFFTLFYNDLEEMVYGGVGMSLRLMPHWRVAPFVGVGGSANLALAGSDTDGTAPENEEPEPGLSYWAGHVETGVQWERRDGVIEILARFVTTSSEIPESDYGLIRLGYGLRF
jgi:hypothetical protein